MKDLIQNLYNGLLRFIPINKYFKYRTGYKGYFPKVGFLDSSKLSELERNLGIKINQIELFEQALLHRSYLQVLSNPEMLSNERLEFLGDSVLGMLVAEYLFSMHSNVLEGELTKMRSWLVNKHSLAYCARKLNLDKFLKMSYSAEKSLRAGSESILADALESIIAAIYIDSGYIASKKFVYDTLIPMMMNKNIMSDKNYKSILLERVQSKGKSSPIYEVVEEKGPDHDKEFSVAVFVDHDLFGTGSGRSKKQAEQNAARMALDNPFFETITQNDDLHVK